MKTELVQKLSNTKGADLDLIEKVFSDDRLTLYRASTPQPNPKPEPDQPKNPLFRERFGLLTDTSLERCTNFYAENREAFGPNNIEDDKLNQAACGILRIETNFGIPTKLSPYPLGSHPAIIYLYSLYVLNPGMRNFAFNQLKAFFEFAPKNGWDVDDLFELPGSPTGAIGLFQFEPSSFHLTVDGDGDGKIDPFNPKDVVASIKHYLIENGWDNNASHQARAVELYYGIPKKKKKHPFHIYYREGVFAYGNAVVAYLQMHPIPTKEKPAAE